VRRISLLLVCALLPATVLAESNPNKLETDIWGGLGAMGGDVTYRIGGTFRSGDIVEEGYFPLSRLEWPLDAALATFGGNARYGEFDARASFFVAISSEGGKVKDSDWELGPDALTTYSESDTELDAWQADGSVRMMIPFTTGNSNETVHLGGGVGVLYQDFSWTAKNLHQWYPVAPWEPHDYWDGEIGTYETETFMPYAEVAGKMWYGGLYFEGRLGLGYAQVQDVDDHKLRYIKAETDADGTGVLAEFIARYTFANNIFVQGSFFMLAYDVEGTEKDTVYAGPDQGTTWEIDHKIESSQMNFTLSGGVSF